MSKLKWIVVVAVGSFVGGFMWAALIAYTRIVYAALGLPSLL
jgi:hypothetical protein